MPISASDVQTWLQVREPVSAGDTGTLALVVASVNSYVDGLPAVRNLADPTVWPESVKLGAIMLAARMWRRRNSPAGIEAMSEAGATYVARHDPDVSRLLQLDGYTAPAVG